MSPQARACLRRCSAANAKAASALHERAVAKDAGASFALSRLQAGHGLSGRPRDARRHVQCRRQRRGHRPGAAVRVHRARRTPRSHWPSSSQDGLERREGRQGGRSGRHQQRRRRRRVGCGGARGDGGGGDAGSEAEAVAVVRLAHGRRKRRLGLALYHRISARAHRPHRRAVEPGHDRPVAPGRRRHGGQLRADGARRGVSRGRQPVEPRPGRHRRQREPRISEPHAEPEVRRPGRSRTHLRAERPLPIRAERHSGRLLLQRTARGLPPAFGRDRPHRLREAPEDRADRAGRCLGAGQRARSSGPRHAARCAAPDTGHRERS